MDITIIFVILILIFSIIIHEVSHGFAANMLGDPTARLQGRLTLNPLPHIDLLGSIVVPGLLVLSHAAFFVGWAKPVPYNPYNLRNQRWGEAIVAAAGPLVNLFIAVVFGVLIRIGAAADLLPPSFAYLTGVVVYINIMLAFFNLLPVPPLDGSKLLKSVLPFRYAHTIARWEAGMAQYGFIITFLFFFAFVSLLWPFFFTFLSWVFLLLTGTPLA